MGTASMTSINQQASLSRMAKENAQKQIDKVTASPDFGKPLRYDLKGERTIYVKPYRLIYKVDGDKLTLLRFEHRDEAYKR